MDSDRNGGFIKKEKCGDAEEMTQRLSVNSVFLEDPNSAPTTHALPLTTTCNPSSRRSDASGLYRHLHLHAGGRGAERES